MKHFFTDLTRYQNNFELWQETSKLNIVIFVFLKHYEAIMNYISQGPMLVNVLMHQPHYASRPYMDALQAFWPGLQVSIN